ncbi:MAG: Ig-like domain-containing protein, partial [Anaerolineae bacterium]|nr:Ig-like domain-containing protein [Anaerolineae bacterium]
QLYDGEKLLGETTADAVGRWRFQVPMPLAEGEHALRTVVLDTEGKEVAVSEAVALTVRPVATPVPTPKPTPVPTPAIVSLPAGASIGAGEPLLLEGTAAPGATLQLYDGEKLLGETTADAVGRWRFQVPMPLAEGEHALRTVVLDTEGKEVAVSEAVALTVRPVATPVPTPKPTPVPTPAIVSLPAGASIGAGEPLLLEGTAAPGATVQLYDGEKLLGETTADAVGRWRFQVPTPLAEGEHVLRTVAVDTEGRKVAASETVTVRVAAAVQMPVISFPKGAAVIPGGPLSGTAEPGARLRIYADDTLLGETVAGADGLWTFQLPGDLSAGALTLRVVAVDAAGRVLAESSPALVEVLELRLPVTGGRQ